MISCETNGNHVAVLRRKLIDDLPSPVGRSVVDKDQLEFLTAQRARRSGHLTVKFAQTLFFVATGHND